MQRFKFSLMDIFLISFGALFSVINPLGTLPIFIGLTKDKERKEILEIALRTALNMLSILLIAFFLGQYILSFFGISIESLKIAGGLIIASSGFALLSGNFTRHKGMKKREKDDAFTRSDISMTPLAIPMLAGPGSISLLITFYQQYELNLERIWVILSIALTCFATFFLLISSRVIVRYLGASGMNALSRIIGFIVIAIGIEYILSTAIAVFDFV